MALVADTVLYIVRFREGPGPCHPIVSNGQEPGRKRHWNATSLTAPGGGLFLVINLVFGDNKGNLHWLDWRAPRSGDMLARPQFPSLLACMCSSWVTNGETFGPCKAVMATWLYCGQ